MTVAEAERYTPLREERIQAQPKSVHRVDGYCDFVGLGKINSLTVAEKLFQAQADASQNVNAPNRWKRLGTNLTNISVLASSVIVGVFAVALFVLSPARGVSNPIIIVMAVISLLSFLSALFEDATGLGKGFLPGTRRYISFANVVLGLIAYLWFPV